MTPHTKRPLADVVTLQRGFDLPNGDRRPGDYPVIGSTAIGGYHDEYKVLPPVVTTGRSGSLGQVVLSKVASWPLNTTLWVKDFHGNDPIFIYYMLQTLGLERFNAGAGVPTLNRNHLASLEAPVPSLPTQRKIAAVLSAYNDLIENNARQVRVLEEMARALYREWFVEYRFPGHEQTEFVEDEQGRRPREWERLEMGQVCTRVTDGAHKSPPSQGDGLPMASVKDMHDWGINLNTCRLISEADFAELVRNDCKPRVGDVLIAKDGSYLKHTFVVEEEQDVVLLSSIAMLRPNQQRITPFYLALHLREDKVKQRLKGYVSGVAIPRIVLKDFRKFQILVPDLSVQGEFERLTQPLRAQVLNLLNRNANLRRTRDLLLPRLVSGELDVSELAVLGLEGGSDEK